MKFKVLATGLAAFSLAAAALAQAPATEFTPEAFRAHVAFLADDLLEGREAGSRGHEIAARYVAANYERLGLRPAADGSWYQQVPFIRYAVSGTPSLSVGDRSLRHGDGVTFRARGEAEPLTLEAPAVFAGYGLDMPGQGHDDYRGLDVRGKVVVVLSGYPQGTASDVGAHLYSDKRRMAALRGAVGLIELRPPSNRPRTPASAAALARPTTNWLDREGLPYTDAPGLRFVATAEAPRAAALFGGDEERLMAAFHQASGGGRPAGFALAERVRVEQEGAADPSDFTSPNVVAVLPGSDPAVADEYVLLMAHLDGVGMAESGPGDRIRNGAMDNATGIATLIEVARQMTQPGNRPRRSILFAAVTAEEKGLLGAEYLARHPVVDGRIVSVVNLDMPILTYDFQDVIAFGAEHSTMGPIVERAAARMGVRLSPDPLPQEGLFTRSDHYEFVKVGVPSVFLMTGFAGEGQRQFTGFLQNQYHSPADDLSLPFDWAAGAKFARLNYLIAQEIANGRDAPLWYSDSFFGDAFGGDRPRARRQGAH